MPFDPSFTMDYNARLATDSTLARNSHRAAMDSYYESPNVPTLDINSSLYVLLNVIEFTILDYRLVHETLYCK